ncbi:MAG: amino acid adenylation domain-containing protein, partial [Actinomycetota bacterium]|nr:amino acid adenylation domain-containing protein [Actinomycetota bacterium]
RYRRDGSIDFLGRADDQVKVRGHRIEPAEVETALRSHEAVRDAAVALKDGRLVAYWTALDSSNPPGPPELRAFLAGVLPAYMIPASFVILDRLPVTPGGKLDRAALPAPGPERPELDRAYDAPETEAERALAEIWSEVLHVDRVGRTDNFFDLGGDSILSIQIVTRAAARGLTILPKHVFEAQTVAELARVASAPPQVPAASAARRVTGAVPLTPIQRWFFEQDLAEPHHFNQAMLFELRPPADARALEGALRDLVEHHDVLRTRWLRDASGWRGVIAAEEDGDLLWTIDLSGRDPASAVLEMEAETARLQSGFDLERGRLIRGALFDFGPLQPPQLLLSIHHLVVDAISWGPLVHDLATAYGELLRGRSLELPAKTASFQEWARHLEDRVGAIDAAEKAMWVERVGDLDAAPLRCDRPDGANVVGSAQEVSFELDDCTSAAIVESIVHEQGVQPNETLLAILGRALGVLADGRHAVVDVEGHGREAGESGLELSRTVGWFTTLFPVVVEPGADGVAALRSVRDQMRAAPDNGIGYGLLRYLGAPADAQPLRDAPQADVSFNYLGRYEGSIGGTGDLEPAEGPVGPLRSPAGARRHLIEAEAWVADGKVRVDLVYSGEVHDRATIERLRDAFTKESEDLVAACTAGVSLDVAEDSEIAELAAARPGVADAYPLSPMQQGLLFHSLYETAGSLYFEQLVLTITAPLDADRLDRAWQQVAARHPLLGASVEWEGIPEPVLLVPAEPRVDVTQHDWRDAADVDEDLQTFLAEDRARGFDLDRALARVALIRVADEVHRMVWSHHHLLLDGWSVQLVLGELLDLYEQPDAALEPAGDYRHFVEWLRAAEPGAAAAYWRDALAGLEAPTDLRLLPPAEPETGHAMVERSLDAATTAVAAAFAREQRITLNTVVEAAWGATLGVYAGTDDVLFGAIMSGRSAPVEGVERTVGLFINTVPIRMRIPAAASVGAWLKELQKESLARRDFEHTPLVEVQQQGAIAAPTPLFGTLIAFENYPLDDVWDEEESSVQISGAPASENTNYPISMVIAPGDGLTFRLSFDRERVDEGAATALLERFVALLRALPESADRPVGALSALTEEDRATLARFNETRADHAKERLVHEIFEEQVALRPDAEAVACGSESVTYLELNRRADALATHLADLGVGPDVLVAICCERTISMVAGMLAVLKAGGAYVPVDPRYPAERIGYMLEDTAAPVLLTDRAVAERVPAGNAKVVLLDAAANGGPPATELRRRAGRNNLAYVLYTSGSTGRPKGIGIEHRSVAAFLSWATATWAHDLKVVMACTSISFDVHVFEIFGTLCYGGTVLLVDDALAFTTLERRHAMTLLNAVPSAVDELVNHGPLPPGIATINLPGEPLNRKLVDRIFAASSAQRIVNLYGPTEDTTYSTAAVLRPGEEGPISIGRPIASSWIYLLDRNLNQVPPGVPGEVYVGGAGLARGYFGRPDMTAERFLPDVGAPEPGARMYKTGDLARYPSDGSLDFMGRLDYQIKIRGFRVELGEIEQTLLEHPQVAHAVVAVRDAASGTRRIVAYIVLAPGLSEPPDPPADLRSHLAARLPDYMVPSTFVVLDALPLNPNGKVDRAALPDPDSTRPEPAPDSGPQSPTEKALASIWRELLEVSDVGRDDSFFELGGQSLLATRLVSRIRETWGVDARLRVVFDAPTLTALASEIETLCGGREAADSISAAVAEIESLSEEDVRRMLAAMEGEVSGGD